MKHRLVLVTLGLLTMSLMASGAKMPDPAVSKYVTTKGAGFNISEGRLFYTVNYKLNQTFTEKIFITIEFENPSDRNNPLIVNMEIAAGEKSISLKSPEVTAIKNNTTYKIVLKLYNDAAHTDLFATHTDEDRLELPPELFTQLGIKELE